MKKSEISIHYFDQRHTEFNPAYDLQDVDQFGFVDLHEAFEKGIIPSYIPDTDEAFNGVMNPGTLIGRSQDVFDSYRKAEYVRRVLSEIELKKSEKDAVEEVVESANETAEQ